MKTVVVLLNGVCLAFTCLVMLTDGFASDPVYVIFSLSLIAVPVFTLTAVARNAGGWARRAAGLSNVVLAVFSIWAFVDQYPHPSEPGFVPYVTLIVLTPLLSATFLFLRREAAPTPVVTQP